MRVFLMQNVQGEGNAEYHNIHSGMTLRSFLESAGISSDPATYHILVNREKATPDTLLNDQDRISVTPLKVAVG